MYSLGCPSGGILADGLKIHWILLNWITSVVCHQRAFLLCCLIWVRMSQAACASILQCKSCHGSLGPLAFVIAFVIAQQSALPPFFCSKWTQLEPSAVEDQWQDCAQQNCSRSIWNWLIVWLKCSQFDRHKMKKLFSFLFLFKKGWALCTLIFLNQSGN